jgi:hypothetical protein
MVLPAWAQGVAGFFPGRYSVEALQAGFTGDPGGLPLAYNFAALLIIGGGAGAAGARLFRWDPGHRPARGARLWIFIALLPWIAAGTGTLLSGKWRAAPPQSDPTLALTDAQIASIRFGGLPPDEGTVAPVAASIADLDPAEKSRLDQVAAKLEDWAPGRLPDTTQAIRNLLCVAVVPDLDEDPIEGAIARVVINHLYAHFSEPELTRSLAWIILHPNEGSVLATMPELGLPDEMDAGIVRSRSIVYATKILGRIRGQLPN